MSSDGEFRFTRDDAILLIRSLVTVKTERYLLSQLLSDFKNEVGQSLPKFEYKNVLEFLKSLTGILEVITENGETFVKLASDQESSYKGSKFLKSSLTPQCEKKIISKPKKPRGFPYYAIGKAKKMMRRRISKVIRRKVEDIPKNQPTVTQKESCLLESSSVLCYRCLSIEGEIRTEPIYSKYLNMVVRWERQIPRINVSYYTDLGDDVEIFVTEVYTPHKFYFQFKKFHNDLAILMESMQEFYSVNSNKYAAIEYKFKIGQVCAVLCENKSELKEWHRARVMNYSDDNTTVFLLDYGKTATVKTCDLKHLDRFYGKLSIQAMRGRLANIKPRRSKRWPESSCRKFAGLIIEKELVARITYIDSKNDCLNMTLSYGDLRLEDFLIDSKLAVSDFNANSKDHNSELDDWEEDNN